MAESQPNGRKSTKWQKVNQMAESQPNGDNIVKRLRGSLKATWQPICSDLLLVYD